jgi:hypothetical protein
MKTALKTIMGVAGGGFLLLLATPAPPARGVADDEVITVVTELEAQQLKLVENQNKIDEKIATIAEAVRQARIFAARGGR